MEIKCKKKECENTITINHKWDAIRAWNEGWYRNRDDTEIRCPEHKPEWLEEWREWRRTNSLPPNR